MTSPKARRAIQLTLGICMAVAPRYASAQVAAPAPLPAIRVPSLTFSAGFGTAGGEGNFKPFPAVSAQWLFGRHFIVEGEATRWNDSWSLTLPARSYTDSQGLTWNTGTSFYADTESVWSVGANLLFRTEPRRVSTFVGAGVMTTRYRTISDRHVEGCVPRPGNTNDCQFAGPSHNERRRSEIGVQGIVGVDVRITGPFVGYGLFQVASSGGAPVRLSGGVRVVARTRMMGAPQTARLERMRSAPRVSANGRQVRISLANGDRRKAVLVDISPAELRVTERGREVRYPIDQVLLVETTRHRAAGFAALGAVIGFFGGWLGSCGSGDEGDCWPEVGALFAGIGAGAGALIGMAADRSGAANHVVYVAPKRTVTLAPVFSPKRAGIAFNINW